MAYCHDIDGFVDAVCEEKEIDKNEYEKVIETDDGKDSLKLVLIFTKFAKQNVGTDNTEAEIDDNEEENFTENSDITYVTKFKDFGVRKVFILAIVPKTPETYRNMRVIIQKTQLNNLDKFLLVADLKLLNIILGLGTHSSRYPCPYGQCFKNKDGKWTKGPSY